MTDSQPDVVTGLRLHHIESYAATQFNLIQFIDLSTHLLKPCDRREDGEHTDGCGTVHSTYRLGTILFAAITLEALINYFGKTKNIKYIGELEQPLSTLNKFRIYPKLAGSDPIKEHVLDRIDLTLGLRNRIVHPKASYKTYDQPFRVFMPHEGAYVFNTLNLAFDALGEPNEQWHVKYPDEIRPTKDIWL